MRTCSSHTASPHFRNAILVVSARWTANLAAFPCRQTFMDLRRCRWRQIRKCALGMVDRMAGGNIGLLWSAMLLWSQRDISLNLRMKRPAQTCSFKKTLEGQRNAASGVLLNDNNWNTFRTQIEHHKLCSENSARLLSRDSAEQRLGSNYRRLNWLKPVEMWRKIFVTNIFPQFDQFAPFKQIEHHS